MFACFTHSKKNHSLCLHTQMILWGIYPSLHICFTPTKAPTLPPRLSSQQPKGRFVSLVVQDDLLFAPSWNIKVLLFFPFLFDLAGSCFGMSVIDLLCYLSLTGLNSTLMDSLFVFQGIQTALRKQGVIKENTVIWKGLLQNVQNNFWVV